MICVCEIDGRVLAGVQLGVLFEALVWGALWVLLGVVLFELLVWGVGSLQG